MFGKCARSHTWGFYRSLTSHKPLKKQPLNIKAYSKGLFQVADSHLIKAGFVMQPFMWFNLGKHEIF